MGVTQQKKLGRAIGFISPFHYEDIASIPHAKNPKS